MAEEIAKQLGSVDEIKVINFGFQSNENPGPILQAFNYDLSKKHVLQKLGETSFERTLKKWKDKLTGLTIIKSKLPNIVYLNEDGWKASIQLRTLFAMINQKTNKEQIMGRFYQLASTIYGGSTKYEEKNFTILEDIIKTYTKGQSDENFITNNILRASKNPA